MNLKQLTALYWYNWI